jgi:gas vesicle protein
MAGDKRGQSFGTGLLLGATIGALAGLFLAPRPGEETRAQMKERTAGLREKAEELAVEARERVREAIEEGKAVASKIRIGHDEVVTEEPTTDSREQPVA